MGTITASYFDARAHGHGIRFDFIAPGKPVQNTYIESFNSRLRHACS